MRIDLIEEQFAQVRRLLLVHHGHIDVEWLAANAETEKDHLNGGQQELEQQQTASKTELVVCGRVGAKSRVRLRYVSP